MLYTPALCVLKAALGEQCWCHQDAAQWLLDLWFSRGSLTYPLSPLSQTAYYSLTLKYMKVAFA